MDKIRIEKVDSYIDKFIVDNKEKYRKFKDNKRILDILIPLSFEINNLIDDETVDEIRKLWNKKDWDSVEISKLKDSIHLYAEKEK